MMKKQITSTLLVLLYSFIFTSMAGSVVYVDVNAPSGGDGNSWCTAYNVIQDGLDDADVLDEEVWVADGIFYEHIVLKDGVGIYGGFTGCGELEETEREQRDWETNLTIVDGSNSGTVVFGTDNATIDGITIQHGESEFGAGMINEFSSPSITNCLFFDNEATWGGGIFNGNSSPLIDNCFFSENAGYWSGGGIYNSNNSFPTITDCLFFDNRAHTGGGIFNGNSSPLIDNCFFSENAGYYYGGGGIYNSNNSSPTIINCDFSWNVGGLDGGAIVNWDSSSPTIKDCIFSGNGDYEYGGAIGNWFTSSPKITNCAFLGNWAGVMGGAMINHSSSPIITNCTFSGNWSMGLLGGGGIFNFSSSSPIISNCILWNNYALIGPEIFNEEGSLTTISYSDIEGCGGSGIGWDTSLGTDGGGNIDNDPFFYKELLAVDYTSGLEITVDDTTNFKSGTPLLITDGTHTESDIVAASSNNIITLTHGFYYPYLVSDGAYIYDYHLQESSPCIDAGTNEGAPSDDIDEEERADGLVDIGADEYVDTDFDEVPDNIDNCPYDHNPEQEDMDEDGCGDVCDNCPNTPLEEIVDPAIGCSIDQLCPCEGPLDQSIPWKNHGKYISCIAKISESFVEADLISELDHNLIVPEAVTSECGVKQ